MSNITYRTTTKITVHLDNKAIGEIREERRRDNNDIIGYRYFPNGGNFSGERFPTLASCKASLEAK